VVDVCDDDGVSGVYLKIGRRQPPYLFTAIDIWQHGSHILLQVSPGRHSKLNFVNVLPGVYIWPAQFYGLQRPLFHSTKNCLGNRMNKNRLRGLAPALCHNA
jgi:hypothetical protein